MAQYKYKEYRKLKRFAVKIDVLDWKTKSSFAYTENLHTEGMLLNSRQRTPIGKILNLELIHVQKNREMIEVPLNALCYVG